VPDDGTAHLSHAAPRDATSHTRAANSRPVPPFDDADFERAARGLIAQHPTGVVASEFGAAWDVSRWDFLRGDAPAPDTVNPSLWRQARLNALHGLFEVAPGCWQVRGYDISNVTFVEGDTGWIVIDPLTATATARDALALVSAHLGERPVVAVIYTHSHLDHFGGAAGVTSQDDVDAGRCRIIAPEHFLREAVAENLLAGNAMLRRSLYQFGPMLPPGPRGHVDSGLGKCVPLAIPTLIPPTEDITHTGQELVVDGVRIVFQLTPETEAPAEMNFFFPDKGWLCMAENCSHNMHNLIPIRGAQARNSLMWSTYIDDAIHLFGQGTELMFASHHWPRWGRDDVAGFLGLQRDLYRWLHDQTLRLANHGYVATEIAEQLQMPPEFFDESHTVGYYGTLVHNVKAVYQRYLSWYDGNPSNLHRHTPTAAGARYVELAGGADALLAHARAKFDEGDYRWVSEVVNHLVFADPTNTAARDLQADALEQLGYQSESATFRNAYLMGAHELRHGHPPRFESGRRGLVRSLPIEQLFATAAMRLKSDEVGGVSSTVLLHVRDLDEHWLLGLSNRAMRCRRVAAGDTHTVDAHVTTTHETANALVAGEVSVADAVASGALTIDGEQSAFTVFVEHLDVLRGGFPIVEP
jgi:alkyl sulfatase BDS1-like metallo-beta-lactamase superfamily hydrolase